MTTILVIDDQLISRQVLCQIVKSTDSGCDIVDFTSPCDALEWLCNNSVRLVFTDQQMPGMSGTEFIREFRRHPKHANVPVIMITADESPDLRDEAVKMGATDFLLKPVDHSVCRELVNQHLGNGDK